MMGCKQLQLANIDWQMKARKKTGHVTCHASLVSFLQMDLYLSYFFYIYVYIYILAMYGKAMQSKYILHGLRV